MRIRDSEHSDQPQRGNRGEHEQQKVEDPLRDAADDPPASEQAEQGRGCQRKVEQQCLTMNQPKGDAEWDFEGNDDQEEPGAGADELVFSAAPRPDNKARRWAPRRWRASWWC